MTLNPPGAGPIDTPQFGVRQLGPMRIVIASPGGGGFGDPRRRDPNSVLRDVADDIVSPAKALKIYGVVLTDHPLSVDLDATRALRARVSPLRPVETPDVLESIG